jgi:hypothetical protein
MPLRQTATYFGNLDEFGSPEPYFNYLIIAKPGIKAGWGVANIISMSEARTTGVAQSPFHTASAEEGGPEAALEKARAFLTDQHPGLDSDFGSIRS